MPNGVLSGAFIEEWLGEQTNTLHYYAAVRAVQGGSFQPERDTRPWLKFAFAAHHRQAQRVQRRYEWTVRLWNDLARLAGLLAAQGHATGRVYVLAGIASEIAEAAAAAARGPGRNPYS
ncbi:hypothetical protein [Actinoplanes sp. CA-252034]|uniref:hypothetical protein n=1 Tax=Actinoplanes sp. CA-252034 TaxID=3239906 RepID=UPI003D9908F0